MSSHKSVLQTEESFHDDWAASITMEDLDIYLAFTAVTVPEFQYALNALGDLKGKYLLDAGCGPGESSIFLANHGAKVTGIDISSGMIGIARKLAAKFEIHEDRLKFTQMDVEMLQFPDATFDLVFGSNIIHHCNVTPASREIARVLKPGGRAVFVDPLGYNPIINYYRRMAFKVRTTREHPLFYPDLDLISRNFRSLSHKEFQFTTLGIFIWFFLAEHVHPNEKRYWRKYVLEGYRYANVFRRLFTIDQFLLNYLPVLRRLCWNVVIICDK